MAIEHPATVWETPRLIRGRQIWGSGGGKNREMTEMGEDGEVGSHVAGRVAVNGGSGGGGRRGGGEGGSSGRFRRLDCGGSREGE